MCDHHDSYLLTCTSVSLFHQHISRRLDGTMTVPAREKAIGDFEGRPEVLVMLVSLKVWRCGRCDRCRGSGLVEKDFFKSGMNAFYDHQVLCSLLRSYILHSGCGPGCEPHCGQSRGADGPLVESDGGGTGVGLWREVWTMPRMKVRSGLGPCSVRHHRAHMLIPNLSPPPNGSQAIDRAHRIGQTRTVKVTRITIKVSTIVRTSIVGTLRSLCPRRS